MPFLLNDPSYVTDNFKNCMELKSLISSLFSGEGWSTKMDANFIDGYVNLGNVLKDAKIYDRAIIAYLRALQLNENNSVVLGNLACIYCEQGHYLLSIETYKKAIELQPNFPDCYCNLANAYKEVGDIEKAVQNYNQALNLNENHADSLNNLGNIRREGGDLEGAIMLYQKALKVNSEFAVAHSNLASVLQTQGHHQQALLHYKEAIRISPNFADAFSNMGNTLKEMQDINGAMQCYNRALQISPSFADAHSNLASIYKDSGNIPEAINCYKMALHFKPDFPDAFCNMAHCLQIICDWTDYDNRMKKINDIINKQLKLTRIPSVHPHHTMLYPLTGDQRINIAKRHADLSVFKIKSLKKPFSWYNWKKPLKERLRIGYVSSDFANHPTSHLMQSIPGCHDRNNVEVFCYALTDDDNTSFRGKVVRESEHFVNLSSVKCNAAAIDIIRNDGINILINLNGYTKGARNELFALRGAPVQALWLGYPGTSGSDYIDYIISDKNVIPKDLSYQYSEKMAYMPNSFFIGDHQNMFPHLFNRYIVETTPASRKCDNISIINIINFTHIKNSSEFSQCETMVLQSNEKDSTFDLKPVYVPILKPTDTMKMSLQNLNFVRFNLSSGVIFRNGACSTQEDAYVATGQEPPAYAIYTSRAQYGLPEESLIFCNFNQLYKFDPICFGLWMKVMKHVHNSVLWLVRFPAAGENNIYRLAETHGIDSSRIIFSNIAPKEEHVRRGQLADICLDSYVCNGHTTGVDILWAGTPVVTLEGESFASRVASSQLFSIGLGNLVAKTTTEFVNIAVELATNTEKLKKIRLHLRNARISKPLFNCKLFSSYLEKLYHKMWNTYESEGTPYHIEL
ncbi:hypothetical protein A3Q56_06592 [Intoshia linei]|uniref:Probable UDP-N-acetylglucosamine--peptide N-acetylglucosaminyltransferase SPINDLY n=1 Tax=Intoshia linei TaxID=1819745 RepID=A0A177AUL5_9BILA|nr:hypothetical protein A3Q56_06592 [Intoshia linei]